MPSDGTPSTIQCPECQAKLKLRNAPSPGKKIICPKCQTPFAIGEEELALPTAEVLEEEEEPQKPKLKKKKRKGSNSSLGLIIGLSIGGLLLVGAMVFGAFFLINSGHLGSKSESLIQNLISNMNELAGVLESVKDENSATAAAPQIASIATKLNDLGKSIKEMKVGKIEDDRLKKKYEDKLKSVGERLRRAGKDAGRIGARVPVYRDAVMKMQSLAF